MPNSLKIIGQRQAIGYFTNPNWPNINAYKKPINYVMRGDGIWEVRNAPTHLLFKKISPSKLLGFTEDKQKTSFVLKHGKIPGALLHEIVAFFKHICDKTKDEAYVQTFWDPEKKEYYNFCPSQKVTSGSVSYLRNSKLEKKHELMLETHSHNTMSAFFSSIDDADEKNDRFYGVVGKLNNGVAEMQFSFVHGGDRELIENIYTVFEEDKARPFPKGWNQTPESQRYRSNTWSGYSGGYNSYQGFKNNNKFPHTTPTNKVEKHAIGSKLIAEPKGPGRTIYRHNTEQDRIRVEVQSAIDNAKRVVPRYPAKQEEDAVKQKPKKQKSQVHIHRKSKKKKKGRKDGDFFKEFLKRLGS